MTRAGITIHRYPDRSWSPEQIAAVDQIFFSSSATQSFANAAERAAFRERWLGRYLLVDASHAFIAIEDADRVVGYLVGGTEDIAHQARFADLWTARAFAAASARFPAHLHINIAEDRRGHGIGARLIEAFAVHAVQHGARGMHVVTSATSRNVHFYERCGFAEIDRITAGSNTVVFLGHRLFAL